VFTVIAVACSKNMVLRLSTAQKTGTSHCTAAHVKPVQAVQQVVLRGSVSHACPSQQSLAHVRNVQHPHAKLHRMHLENRNAWNTIIFEHFASSDSSSQAGHLFGGLGAAGDRQARPGPPPRRAAWRAAAEPRPAGAAADPSSTTGPGRLSSSRGMTVTSGILMKLRF